MKFGTIIKSSLISLALGTTMLSAANYELVTSPATVVTASTTESYEYPASNLIDGNLSTRWASDFADNQEILIDLRESKFIDKIVLEWEAAYAKKFNVYFSNDNVNWNSGRYLYNYDGHVGTMEFEQDFSKFRYVKIELDQRATQYGFSLFEIQLYQDLDLHPVVKSVQLKSYAPNGGVSKPECNNSTHGTMVVEETGHYYGQSNAYVCLKYWHPTYNGPGYGWVPMAVGNYIPENQ